MDDYMKNLKVGLSFFLEWVQQFQTVKKFAKLNVKQMVEPTKIQKVFQIKQLFYFINICIKNDKLCI